MIIQLTCDLPIDKKHKCFKGERFKVIKKKYRRNCIYFFHDHNGIECGAYNYEFRIIQGNESEIPHEQDISDLGNI